jgi:hypothetical protein
VSSSFTTLPLERAADAHRELEARRSVGAIVLTVDQVE